MSPSTRRQRPARPRDERGVALLPTIVIFFVCMMLLALTTDSVGNEVLASTRSVNTSLTRTAASAGYSYLLSNVELDSNFFTDGGASALADRWVTITPTGSIAPCPTSGQVVECLYLSYSDAPAVSGSSGQIKYPERAVVQVSAIHGYPPVVENPTSADDGAGVADSDKVVAPGTAGSDVCGGVQSTFQCAAVTYRSTLIRRSYLDYLQFDNSESMAPEAYPGSQVPPASCSSQSVPDTTNCLYPAYQGQTGSSAVADQIDGPFHTNSPFFLTCGTPSFLGRVEYSSASTGASGNIQGVGCTGRPSFSETPVALPPIPLPVPSALRSLQQEAPPNYQLNNGAIIDITPAGIAVDGTTVGGVALTGTPQPYPASGVVSVQGNAYVEGSVSGKVTIAATGSIFIFGDLTYACTGGGAGSVVPSTCADMTGLIAGGDILLGHDLFGSSPWSSNLTVDAAMMAIGSGNPSACGGASTGTAGTIYAPSWADAPTGITLTVNGSFIENCRGAVGSYSSSNGLLISGFAANLHYDSRFAASQPPDFLAPTGGEWTRISVFGVPYGTPVLATTTTPPPPPTTTTTTTTTTTVPPTTTTTTPPTTTTTTTTTVPPTTMSATMTQLVSSPSSTTAYTTVTLTATVMVYTGQSTPTGTVAFSSNGTTITGCGAVLLNLRTSSATCSYQPYSSGTYSLSAVYAGDSTHAGSTGTASLPVTAAVPPPPP